MSRKGLFDETTLSTAWVKTIALIVCSLPIFYFVARLGDRILYRLFFITMTLVLSYRLFRNSGLSASYGMSLFWALLAATLIFCFIHRLLQINSEQERVLLDQLAADTSGRHSDEFLSRFLDSILSVLPYSRASIHEFAESANNEPDESADISIAYAGAPDDLPLPSMFEVPLKESGGKLLGQLRLESSQPVDLSPLQTSTLKAFVTRAAAEVSRKQSDRRHRSLQDKLLQVQKLESIGLLAGGIAHDLNNILAAAHNYLSLARDTPQDAHDLKSNLEHVHVALERAELLCNRLLAYAGRTERHETDCDINQLVSETISILNAASSSTIEQTLCEPTLYVRGDSAQLSQVVLNLLTNAIDAIGTTGGTIEVRTSINELESITEAGGDRNACIEIQDSGPGIKEELVNKIFDPFFSTKGKGRGLGLSAVAGIVKAHDGQIEVKSSMAGTVFLVELPMLHVDSLPEETVTPPAVGMEHSSLRVLLVEDNEHVMESTRVVLQRAGMEVEVAMDGERAIQQFETHGDVFDVYLVDYNLGNGFGTNVIESLRELGASGCMFLMSGGGEAQLSQHDEITFIPKPFSPPELLSTLREVVNN